MKEKGAYGIDVVGSSLASGANNVEGVAVKMEGVLHELLIGSTSWDKTENDIQEHQEYHPGP